MVVEEHPSDRRRVSDSLVFGGRCLCIFSPLQKCLIGLLNRAGDFNSLQLVDRWYTGSGRGSVEGFCRGVGSGSPAWVGPRWWKTIEVSGHDDAYEGDSPVGGGRVGWVLIVS